MTAVPTDPAPAAVAAPQAAPSPPDPGVRARLDGVRDALDAALASMRHASTSDKGNYVELTIAAITQARKDVDEATAYLAAHPESGQPVAIPSSAKAALYLPADLTGHDSRNRNGQWFNPRLVESIQALNGALTVLTREAPGGGKVFTVGELGGFRDKTLAELMRANAYCLVGMDLADGATSVPVSRTSATFPAWNSEGDMNFYFVDRFVSSGAPGPRGGVQPFSPLLGRDYHLKIADVSAAAPVAAEYAIDSVELLSVGGTASHLYPVVTAAHTHQTSAKISRGLTDFETKSLALLRTGVEVSIYTDQDQRTVVGAIRANASCLSCHTGVRPGDLLGAFTYHLTALKPPAAKP
ncbi:MAG TPA: hypothetical protein VHC95_13760 [Opitutales bacterium]|nr:hypothetical protein [Opitutales bacterium]